MINDLYLELTVVYVMNNMLEGLVGDERGRALTLAAFDAVGG